MGMAPQNKICVSGPHKGEEASPESPFPYVLVARDRSSLTDPSLKSFKSPFSQPPFSECAAVYSESAVADSAYTSVVLAPGLWASSVSSVL